MRILVAIPHYVGPPVAGGITYGSSLRDAGPARAAALRRTILGLRVHLGDLQARGEEAPPGADGRPRIAFRRANLSGRAMRLDIVVVVIDHWHALMSVDLPAALFEVERLSLDRLAGDPRQLGFACHDVLAARAEGYDWVGYLEDDTVIADPWFLRKIAFVEREMSGEAVLLPNRFEVSPTARYHKTYVDGPIAPEMTRRWQDVMQQGSIGFKVLGETVVLARASNPHAGCFFLSARQFASWRAQSYFSSREPLFAGPLESAACLGIMRTFRLYKPALENASFLEAEHLNNRGWLNFLD